MFYYCLSSGVADLHMDLLLTTHVGVSTIPPREIFICKMYKIK